MNNSSLIETQAELQQVFESQRSAFLKHPYPEYEARIAQLKALKKLMQSHQDDIADAISADFGARSRNESKLIDVLGCVLDINHTIKSLKKWMKPSKRSPEILFAGNKAEVRYQPKGVVGIIVPWNFPVYLAVVPMAAAIAAGNRVILKMSESTPETGRLLADMLAKIYPQNEVAVVGGDLELARYFPSLPYDHLLYTGSTQVGRLIMRAASENLTPVTLELGGKSPAIVSHDCDLEKAARKIAHGKTTNGGQVCIAPDYVFVPQSLEAEFLAHLKSAWKAMYLGKGDKTEVITQRHYDRLQGLVKEAEEQGANVDVLADGEGKYLPLTVVTGVNDSMKIMREEIFGSLLPVMTYQSMDEVITHINNNDRPLALYYFGEDQSQADYVLEHTHSGGVSINDWGWHAFNNDLPFGGVGASGMGRYHGREGFIELSHARGVFIERSWFPVQLFHPPYGLLHKLVFRVFLGKGRSS